jgi:hypothetical protein
VHFLHVHQSNFCYQVRKDFLKYLFYMSFYHLFFFCIHDLLSQIVVQFAQRPAKMEQPLLPVPVLVLVLVLGWRRLLRLSA